MVLKIPTLPGSYIEVVIKADLPMHQLAALSEAVRSGKYTLDNDVIRAALRQAAIDRLEFLKTKENGALLEKDNEQMQLEHEAVMKLQELVELLIEPTRPESEALELMEGLLKNWFNKLWTAIVNTILGSILVYGKTALGKLSLHICFDHPFSGEFEFFPDWQMSLQLNMAAEPDVTPEDNTGAEVPKAPECNQTPEPSNEELIFAYKWMLEEYRKMEPQNENEKVEIDEAKSLLKEMIRAKSSETKG